MEEPPALRVVRGTPTPEELVAVLVALRARTRPEQSPEMSAWVRSGRPGPGGRAGWRARPSPAAYPPRSRSGRGRE